MLILLLSIVNKEDQKRFAAHIVVVYLLTCKNFGNLLAACPIDDNLL